MLLHRKPSVTVVDMLAEPGWLYLSVFSCWLLLYVVGPLAVIVFQHTIGVRYFSKRRQLPRAGEWAVITGASDGIGKAFAEELASDGLSVMLVSRTEAKLKAVSEEIASRYGVPTRYAVMDFTQSGSEVYERLAKEFESLSSIACLVNNVGMVNVYPQAFADGPDMSLGQISDFIACNCLSMAAVTRILLPRLIAQRSPAAVINMSSFSGMYPLPYISLYAATKAFDRHFSDCLRLELAASGSPVLVQTVLPMYVRTSMCPRQSYFTISPRDCARISLNLLGVSQCTVGHIRHALQVLYFLLLPYFSLSNSMRQKAERARQRAASANVAAND